MKKIIIIGAGIAGLSVAHLLSNYNFNIEIYEKEDRIGGQASSKFSELCYTEYSWRIFGSVYDNLMYIINQIGAKNNFTPFMNPCLINKDNISSANINTYNLTYQILKDADYQTINKLIGLLFLCRERAVNDYNHLSAYEYFNKNTIMQTILGPFLGLEANKVSLSTFMKNFYSTSASYRYPFSPSSTLISKYPTQQSLFVPWKKYLINRGVKIYTNSALQKINCNGNTIESIVINNQIKKADDYVFACSLLNFIHICFQNNYLKKCPTIDKLNIYKKICSYISP